jgi:hypothetical protein
VFLPAASVAHFSVRLCASVPLLSAAQVLDDASEVDVKHKSRKNLGRVMLKGDNITAIFNAPAV